MIHNLSRIYYFQIHISLPGHTVPAQQNHPHQKHFQTSLAKSRNQGDQ